MADLKLSRTDTTTAHGAVQDNTTTHGATVQRKVGGARQDESSTTHGARSESSTRTQDATTDVSDATHGARTDETAMHRGITVTCRLAIYNPRMGATGTL